MPPTSRSGLLEDLRRSAEAVAQACKRSNEMERAFLEKKVLNREANEALDDFRRKRGQFGEYLLQRSDEIIAALSEKQTIKYERVSALDKRIAYGDDFAGDAWVRWTAVGHKPEDAA